MSSPAATNALEHAEKIASILRERGIQSAIIGGAALAAYSYVRATGDVDLGTAVDVWTTLRDATEALRQAGYPATLEYPDEADPLGGVVTITPPASDPIQIVNFLNPYSGGAGAFVKEALSKAKPPEGLSVPVIPLPHLIALKLYAGGGKSVGDVMELLRVNPHADRAEIRKVCEQLGLANAFDRLVSALRTP